MTVRFLIAILGLCCSLPTLVNANEPTFNPQLSCIVELRARNGNGMVLDTFEAYRCSRAHSDCERELDRRNRQGLNPYARCVESNRNGGGGGEGGGNEFEVIDEVIFRNGSTSQAILACQAGRQADERCMKQGYSCSQCSDIAHSDQSSYVVYATRRTAERRVFVNTFHFRDRQTAVAYQKCVTTRDRMPECSSRQYECTPCSVESHTDHSEFSLFELIR